MSGEENIQFVRELSADIAELAGLTAEAAAPPRLDDICSCRSRTTASGGTRIAALETAENRRGLAQQRETPALPSEKLIRPV